MQEPILLLSGHHGIYIPKLFVETYLNHISEVDEDTLNDCRFPDSEDYEEAWQEVLDCGILTDVYGKRYILYQNQDLWAIPEGQELPEGWGV